MVPITNLAAMQRGIRSSKPPANVMAHERVGSPAAMEARAASKSRHGSPAVTRCAGGVREPRLDD